MAVYEVEMRVVEIHTYRVEAESAELRRCVLIGPEETPLQREMSTLAQNYVCIVCQELIACPVVLECEHRFCWGCIMRHQGASDKTKYVAGCPICRKPMSTAVPVPSVELHELLTVLVKSLSKGAQDEYWVRVKAMKEAHSTVATAVLAAKSPLPPTELKKRTALERTAIAAASCALTQALEEPELAVANCQQVNPLALYETL